MNTNRLKTSHSRQHGTTTSYLVGFILSLIFTLIPYSFVVNQTLKGRTLMFTILGFAFLQMLIQIIFFLHIGRGSKPRWNLFFFASTVSIILLVVIGSIVIINNLHYNMAAPDQVRRLVDDEGIHQVSGLKTGACYGQHENHIIKIKNSQMTPTFIYAELCDTLTVINDNAIRIITFGAHENHSPYAGNLDLPIKPNKSKTITLSESGTYIIHDHLNDKTSGMFTVKP